jgi:hypothetical protein
MFLKASVHAIDCNKQLIVESPVAWRLCPSSWIEKCREMGYVLEAQIQRRKICKVMNISRKRHPFVAEYIVNGKNLQHVSSQMERSYLRASYENQLPACYCMFKLSTIKVKNVNYPTLSLPYTYEISFCLCLTSVVSIDYHHGARRPTSSWSYTARSPDLKETG